MNRIFSCLLALGLLPGLASCDASKDLPKKAVSLQVAKDDPNSGRLWPILLQHCSRSPSCDPMANFGEGAGEASGIDSAVLWYAQSKAVAGEGAKDYGARIRLSMLGSAATGGDAGRPLANGEGSSDLRAKRDSRSWLTLEFRAPSGTPEPYFLSYQSPQILFMPPPGADSRDRKALRDRTAEWTEIWKWPDGGVGAKIDVRDKTGVLWSGYSTGLAVGSLIEDDDALNLGSEPWRFYISQNIRDEPLEKLTIAIAKGETLNVEITTPEGRILHDTLYTTGYSGALKAATAALGDAAIDAPLTTRCASLLDKDNAFWIEGKGASPAAVTCDPRTLEQRRTDERRAAEDADKRR
jgi:hypothetical protein